MNPLAIYTLKENLHGSHSQQHKLVRAAWAKGLTNISITRYKSDNQHPGPGWWLKCDEYEKPLHLGYQVGEAEARINKISYTPSMPGMNTPLDISIYKLKNK